MKFSIVTPTFNSAQYISDTVLSVLSQRGNFSIEYFIIDNCSTDNTKEIIEEFQNLLKQESYPLVCEDVQIILVSEPDKGMYEAINKGFSDASGDVYAWINADDIYLPGAFATIAKIFDEYDDIHWLKGITSYISESTNIWRIGDCILYAQDWIKAGIYGRDHHFIQQDSVFWRSWLWHESGGIETSIKRAGDYYLWIRFAKYASLVTVNSSVSCFRSVAGQLSQDVDTYTAEARGLSPGDDKLSNLVRWFFQHENSIPMIIKPILFKYLFGRIDHSVVLIDVKGNLKRVIGEYYDVMGAL